MILVILAMILGVFISYCVSETVSSLRAQQVMNSIRKEISLPTKPYTLFKKGVV